MFPDPQSPRAFISYMGPNTTSSHKQPQRASRSKFGAFENFNLYQQPLWASGGKWIWVDAAKVLALFSSNK